MGPHSSTLAWKILWMEEPARLQFMGSLRIRYNLTTKQQTITTKQWPFFALDTFLFLKFVLPEINIVIYAFF